MAYRYGWHVRSKRERERESRWLEMVWAANDDNRGCQVASPANCRRRRRRLCRKAVVRWSDRYSVADDLDKFGHRHPQRRMENETEDDRIGYTASLEPANAEGWRNKWWMMR